VKKISAPPGKKYREIAERILAKIGAKPLTILILGSYKPEYKKRLKLVRKVLNKEGWLAFLAEDIDIEQPLSLLLKVASLAKEADVIVAIIEDDVGGVIVETTLIAMLPQISWKTGIFVKDEAKLSVMLEKGIFRLPPINRTTFRFSDDEDLLEKILDFVRPFEDLKWILTMR